MTTRKKAKKIAGKSVRKKPATKKVPASSARSSARGKKRAAAPAPAAVRVVAKPPAPPAIAKVKLSKAQKKKYTDSLLRLRDRINSQISFLANDSLKKQNADEPRDDVTDDFDRDFALNLLTSEHNIMFEINEALKRVSDSTYGRCEKCNCTITVARLEAVPFARMCISCQSSTEKGKPRFQPFGNTMDEVGTAAASPSSGSADE